MPKILLFSSVHELGHLVALLLLGGSPKRLTLSFYGLALRYDECLPRARETVVLSSGLIVNLTLYLLLRDDINLILMILNSLPVYPLDGGRIVRLYSVRLSRILSAVLLAAVSAMAVYQVIYFHSFSLLLICVYLVAYSINN